MSAAFARELAELRPGDEDRFGGKSANLGALLAAGVRVPAGFALSTDAFAAFMTDGLEDRVRDAFAGLDPTDVAALAAAAEEIGAALRATPIPRVVRSEIERRHAALGPHAAVAVRSSARGEDAADATFAGQQETFLWVRGIDAVAEAIRDCWASLYSAPAISYRGRLGAADAPPAMGVTVQLMVDAAVAGVLFTRSPVSGDPSVVAVDASWGLGIGVVGGEVTPDEYVVSKITGEVLRRTIGRKLVRFEPAADGGTIAVPVAPEEQEAACLDDAQLGALADLGVRIERHAGSAQDVEWAIARGTGEILVLQARPVTAAPRGARVVGGSALSMVMGAFGARPPEPS